MKIQYEVRLRRRFAVGVRVAFWPRAKHTILALGWVEVRRIVVNEPSDLELLIAGVNAALRKVANRGHDGGIEGAFARDERVFANRRTAGRCMI